MQNLNATGIQILFFGEICLPLQIPIYNLKQSKYE